MRKEVIFAIIAGISIGLIVAVGTWKVARVVKKNTPAAQLKVTPSPKKNVGLTIDGPLDYDVVTKNPVIKGLTAPETDIIISTYEKDFYTKSSSQGEFQKEIELPAGLSEILINNQKLILVHSTEVEENSTSYVGTITDISENTIQIKNISGEIKQISVNNETSFINSLKKNVNVKAIDLAIGDYIVAMGKINGNKVLKTQRILITSPLVENKIEVQKIKIEKLSKTKINDIDLPKKWVGPNTKDLEISQEIIITGTKTDSKFDLRSIFVATL